MGNVMNVLKRQSELERRRSDTTGDESGPPSEQIASTCEAVNVSTTPAPSSTSDPETTDQLQTEPDVVDSMATAIGTAETEIPLDGSLSATDLQPGAEATSADYRKVVVFGPSGAGKSSLINLLTDNEYDIKVSSRACGVTFSSQAYFVPSRKIELIDTVGIGEAQLGTAEPDCEDSLEKLVNLLCSFEKGVHLFVMVRPHAGGSILQASDEKNYKVFIDNIGRKKVPSLLAVTGCEFMTEMAGWGESNKEYFDKAGLSFDKIVSGTCLAEGPMADIDLVRQRREQTKQALWEAIDEHISPKPIKVSESTLNPRREMLKLACEIIVKYVTHVDFFSVGEVATKGVLSRASTAAESLKKAYEAKAEERKAETS